MSLNLKGEGGRQDIFGERFTVKVDTSECVSMVDGFDRTLLDDCWRYKDCTFESGKIYGLVSEYGQGGMYLSHLLGGRLEFQKVKIYCNDVPVTQNDLNDVGWNLESSNEPYGKKEIRKTIEKALAHSGGGETFMSVAERFLLTPERYDRRFRNLSGERWRASAAYGYALGKRIFFAPYETSKFYHHMCQSALLKALRELAGNGGLVVLPVGSDKFIKHIADEVIYLDPEYDIDELKSFYTEEYCGEWIH
ncbi:MAG: hypothetical protein K2N72_06985 [Oscillospiraceae bacterium]|nr:hypothetical protein [Oscillospiraceae bacterium]